MTRALRRGMTGAGRPWGCVVIGSRRSVMGKVDIKYSSMVCL